MSSITVKIDEELKNRMRALPINWSEYVRGTIRQKIDLEERRIASKRLLDDLKNRRHPAPQGFINETLREMRETS